MACAEKFAAGNRFLRYVDVRRARESAHGTKPRSDPHFDLGPTLIVGASPS